MQAESCSLGYLHLVENPKIQNGVVIEYWSGERGCVLDDVNGEVGFVRPPDGGVQQM